MTEISSSYSSKKKASNSEVWRSIERVSECEENKKLEAAFFFGVANEGKEGGEEGTLNTT